MDLVDIDEQNIILEIDHLVLLLFLARPYSTRVGLVLLVAFLIQVQLIFLLLAPAFHHFLDGNRDIEPRLLAPGPLVFSIVKLNFLAFQPLIPVFLFSTISKPLLSGVFDFGQLLLIRPRFDQVAFHLLQRCLNFASVCLLIHSLFFDLIFKQFHVFQLLRQQNLLPALHYVLSLLSNFVSLFGLVYKPMILLTVQSFLPFSFKNLVFGD